VYNPGVNLACVVQVMYEFPVTDAVVTTTHVVSVQPFRYVTAGDYVFLVLEVMFVVASCFAAVFSIRRSRQDRDWVLREERHQMLIARAMERDARAQAERDSDGEWEVAGVNGNGAGGVGQPSNSETDSLGEGGDAAAAAAATGETSIATTGADLMTPEEKEQLKKERKERKSRSLLHLAQERFLPASVRTKLVFAGFDFLDVLVFTLVVCVLVARFVQAGIVGRMPAMQSGVFVDLSDLVAAYSFEMDTLGLVALFSWLRLLKFTRKIAFVGLYTKILFAMAWSFVPFALLMLLMLMAYAHCFFLVFHNDMLGYETFASAFMKVFRLMLGEKEYDRMVQASPILGGVLFVVFMVTVWLFLLRLIITVLTGAYNDTVTAQFKREAKEEAKEADIFQALETFAARITEVRCLL
jgi:hypothetical protein